MVEIIVMHNPLPPSPFFPPSLSLHPSPSSLPLSLPPPLPPSLSSSTSLSASLPPSLPPSSYFVTRINALLQILDLVRMQDPFQELL